MTARWKWGMTLGLGAALLMGGEAVAQQTPAEAQIKGKDRNLPAKDVLGEGREPAREVDRRDVPGTVERDVVGREADDRPEAVEPAASEGFYRATDLIGMPIQAEGEARVGVVKDIVIDGRTNEVAYFVVETAAALRTEGMLIVPYAAVSEPIFVEGRPAKFIALSLGVDRLRQAPTITSGRLTTLRDPGFFVGVNRFFGVDNVRRGFRAGDRDRRGRGRLRDRDRDGDRDRDRVRDGDRRRDRDRDGADDADRPRRPRDRDGKPGAEPRNRGDRERPQIRPDDKKNPASDADAKKPGAKPEVKPEKPQPGAETPATQPKKGAGEAPAPQPQPETPES